MKHVLKPVHDSDKREKKVFSQVDFETGKLTLGLGIIPVISTRVRNYSKQVLARRVITISSRELT